MWVKEKIHSTYYQCIVCSNLCYFKIISKVIYQVLLSHQADVYDGLIVLVSSYSVIEWSRKIFITASVCWVRELHQRFTCPLIVWEEAGVRTEFGCWCEATKVVFVFGCNWYHRELEYVCIGCHAGYQYLPNVNVLMSSIYQLVNRLLSWWDWISL